MNILCYTLIIISSGIARGAVGAYASPEKGKVRRKKLFFGVKNLKTLKGGSLSVLVNSEPTLA